MTGHGSWVVISNYPAWPSPYFAEMQRHAPTRFRLAFARDLEAIERRSGSPGVINLHRLKRLYLEPGGRTLTAAETMLARLAALRQAGWRIVWTVHNLLPIDGGAPTEADHHAAHGVLGLADAIITHTRADARHLATLTGAPVIVAGWAGPTAGTSTVPREIRELVEQLAEAPTSVLLLGNLTAYKDLPTVTRAFASHTRTAHLFVVGPARDASVADVAADDRIHLHLERIPPEHIHALYRAADVALCPYRTEGPWEFFTRVLHPSSVGTAVAFGTPVIAPELPAVTEMTAGHPRWLYPPQAGPGQMLAAVETVPLPRLLPAGNRGWHTVLAAYETLAAELLGTAAIRSSAVTRSDTRQRAVPAPDVVSPDKETHQMLDQPIAALLFDRYGLAVRGLAQLPIGQGTVNYRATCTDGDVFVKNYQAGTDLAGEEGAIELSELAHRHGIPGATVLRNRDGRTIDATTALAVSVWEWMPGRVVTELNTLQCEQAGQALGRIHALFASLPASSAPAPEVDQWRHVDIGDLTSTIDRLLEIIDSKTADGIPDAFDAEARRTLTERHEMVPRIPGLLADLPKDLAVQVVHGDYSPVNLLFVCDELSAVLDFRPPNPFLVAYDLGRMAFYPNTVTGDPHWLEAARTLIAGYLTANPAVADIDIRACGRVALLQLLRSLYGVKQHYLKPGLFQDDLDEFWLLRHNAVDVMLRHLPQMDALLDDLTANRPLSGHQRGES